MENFTKRESENNLEKLTEKIFFPVNFRIKEFELLVCARIDPGYDPFQLLVGKLRKMRGF